MTNIPMQSKDGDPRIASVLDAEGINYDIDADGDFHIVFDLPEERSHAVFISSDTYEHCGEEMRAVYAVALKSVGPFDARTTNRLLDMNSKVLTGAWSVVRDANDNHLAIFGARISADRSGKALLHVVQAVVETADYVEERLSGRDDY